jgi:hypothetical protein
MKYVNMNEVAYDANAIAFPGLGHCHGVVYKTSNGLFAMHIYGGEQETPAKATLFADFVKANVQGNAAVGSRLYGLCPANRFTGTGKAGQKAELKLCADALGFTGQIEGAMWNLADLGVGAATTYVEFTMAVGGAIDIRIENFTGQLPALSPNPHGVDQKTVGVVRVPFTNTIRWTELKVPNQVVLGVVKKPGAVPWIVHTSVL